MVAKCITDEKVGRKVFYGAMISESVIALVWAAAGVAFYGTTQMLNDALSGGAIFKDAPHLPHKLNGIIVGHNVIIGKCCIIHQQVTIVNGTKTEPTIIGDNCMIGKGATVLSGCKIGDRVKIGANAVVVGDVPSDSTVVGVPAKIVRKRNEGTGCEKSFVAGIMFMFSFWHCRVRGRTRPGYRSAEGI